MKKVSKYKKKKSNTVRNISLAVLFILFGVIAVVLPSTQTKKLSYGASIPFTPVPAKSNLQLEWFLVPTGTSATQTQPGNTVQPTQPKQPVNAPRPTVPFQPGNATPTTGGIGRFQPATTLPPFKSNGQLCSVVDNSGKAASGSCYCPALQVTCKNGIGYGANGKLYPGVNPCGTKAAPGSGRYCVEKPVIYLYPTVPTLVAVQVITSGSVVVSNPYYPTDGWKNILAKPNGALTYNGKDYSELFYESSVNTFQQPHLGLTIQTNQLSEKLSILLDRLGLIGHEKKEFLSFWLPRLEALHSPYIFFSILNPSAKADIDTVAISPKPDTQIAFIAYFKAVSQPTNDTLQLPSTPKRYGFVSVEWGGVIGD